MKMVHKNDGHHGRLQQNENEIPLNTNIATIEEGNEDQQRIDGNGIKDNRRQQKSKLINITPKSRKYIIIGGIILILLILAIFLLVTFLNQPTDQFTKEADIQSTTGVTDSSTAESVTVSVKTKEIPNAEVPQGPSPSILHVFPEAAICSDSSVCSKIGRDIFRKGGNVVDSALATLFCNGMTTMQSMGIGGGFIMNIYNKSENIAYTIDAREVAPLGASEDMFVNLPKEASLLGPLAIAVPGEVMGYHEAYTRYGSMSWRDLIEPSIKICTEGFPLSKHMSDALNINKNSILNDPHLSNMFVNNKTGELHRIGTIVYPSKELCNTYRLLSKNGPMSFYDGELAHMIIEDLQELGSILTADDLKVYRADVIHSISVRLNDDTMYVVPPVGSGVVVANMLNILKGYNFTPGSIANDNDTELTYHRIVEAFKFSYAKRYELGDLRFNRDLGDLISNLTSSHYGDSIRQLINDNETYDDPKHYGANFWTDINNGTSHMSLLAPNGDAVAVTSSINFYFGCGLTGNRTGIIFNSGMEDYSKPGHSNIFKIPSSKPNLIRPRKRAMSSMSPTIVTDLNGDVKLVIGAAGGAKIPTSIAQVIARVLWFGQDIKQALDAPRIHHQLLPNTFEYEYGVLQHIIDSLEDRGHVTERYRERGSTMCGIVKNSTAVYANADYRKEGDVAGL